MTKNKNKDNKIEIIQFRCSVDEKLKLLEMAKYSKNLSKYIRHILHLDD